MHEWNEDKPSRPEWCPLEAAEESLPKMSYRMVGGEYHNHGGTIPSVESEKE